MPTYQYRCAKCGEQFEVWQSIHDDALTTHDGDCAGSLAKVLAVGGIVLKGPGFYRTDNRSGSPDGRGKDGKEKESAGSNGTGDKASGSGTSEKKDSKPSESKASPSKSDAAKT